MLDFDVSYLFVLNQHPDVKAIKQAHCKHPTEITEKH